MLRTPLHSHIEKHEDFYQNYESYQVDLVTLKALAQHQPTAHVLIVHRITCKDCIRNVPAMTRIAEYLPGWTWEIVEDYDAERKAALGITHVPTFIVYDRPGGVERGRIIENPLHGSLEADLHHMLTTGG